MHIWQNIKNNLTFQWWTQLVSGWLAQLVSVWYNLQAVSSNHTKSLKQRLSCRYISAPCTLTLDIKTS